MSNTYKLFLMPSLDCNLNCSYCELKNLNVLNKSPTYNLDNIIKSVNELVPNETKSKTMIIYYGGEPLLYLSRIASITSILKKQGFSNFYIITNGTLLNNDKLSEIKQIGIKSITVSIDPKENNLKDRGVDFNNLIKVAKIVKEHNLKLQISSTITQKINIKKHITKLLKINPDYIGFNFATPEGADSISEKDLEYVIELYLNKNIIISPFINRFYKKVISNSEKTVFCGYYNNKTYGILPDGSYEPCQFMALSNKIKKN